MKLGEAVYKSQQQTEAQQPTQENTSGKKEDVVDAEFEEVKK